MLKYDSEVDSDWTVPDPATFRDLLGRVDSEVLEFNLPCRRAFLWGNLWGRIGLVGLSSKDLTLVNEFRLIVENQILRTTRFTLFPREALEKKGNLTVLLREGFRTFDVAYLPKAILLRSPLLRGGLRITHIKHYGDEEYSRTGACKAGWRLVLLQGCPLFMDSLTNYEQDHKFPVASGHVLLRGGTGRPKGQNQDDRPRQEAPGGRDRGRPRQQQHHQDHHDKQRQRRASGGRRPGSSDRSRHYLSLIHI